VFLRPYAKLPRREANHTHLRSASTSKYAHEHSQYAFTACKGTASPSRDTNAVNTNSFQKWCPFTHNTALLSRPTYILIPRHLERLPVYCSVSGLPGEHRQINQNWSPATNPHSTPSHNNHNYFNDILGARGGAVGRCIVLQDGR
jgi:hypothetical protein